jgi:hypothetical protein
MNDTSKFAVAAGLCRYAGEIESLLFWADFSFVRIRGKADSSRCLFLTAV